MTNIHHVAAAVIGLAVIGAVPASAQQPSAEAGAIVATGPGVAGGAQMTTVSAKVVAIDRAKRAVTLQGPLGNRFRVVAGQEVRNFDQIQVGNELVVTHAEALTLELQKGGAGIRERVESQDAARTPAGARPGVAEVNRVTVIADVAAVNARTQTVTLRGVDYAVDLHVPDKSQFAAIRTGDQVRATYTEAVAIAMEPARKK